MAFLAKQMEMFPHSEYMVEFHDHWKSGSPHVALAASIVEQMYVLLRVFFVVVFKQFT